MKMTIGRWVPRWRERICGLAGFAAALLMLAGCAGPPSGGSFGPAEYKPAPGAARDVEDIITSGLRSGDSAINRNSIGKARVRPAEERPGLATGFGESVPSDWNRQSFVRAAAKPAGTGAIYYNNREGVDAMTGWKEKTGAMQTAAGGMVEWGIKGGFGYLTAYATSSDRRFVVGERDGSYSIVVKNRCKSRLEVVLSVDGLDVMDGKTAGFAKRGYVIAPNDTLEVKGWRTSPSTVARFKFSSVGGSYANLKHGDTRNVGVIGLAVFGEKGVDPWTWMPREVNDRLRADPFATAP